MRLWMSGEIMADVGDAHREARKAVQALVNERLADVHTEFPIDEWAFISIIRKTDHPDYGEVVKSHKRDRSLEFRLKIDHGEFKAAGATTQKLMIIDALRRSVDRMEELSVPAADRDSLRAVLTDVEADIKRTG